jgi:hypothetical protein
VQRTLAITALALPSKPTATTSRLTFPGTSYPNTSPAQSVTFTAYNGGPLDVTVTGDLVFTQGSACPSTPCTLSFAFVPADQVNPTFSGQVTAFDPIGGGEVAVYWSGTNTLRATLPYSPNSVVFAALSLGTNSVEYLNIANTGLPEGTIKSAVFTGVRRRITR